MKNYKNNSDVAHAWANQLTPDGKGSHFYFEDNIIYSYGRHFPLKIAELLNWKVLETA